MALTTQQRCEQHGLTQTTKKVAKPWCERAQHLVESIANNPKNGDAVRNEALDELDRRKAEANKGKKKATSA
jgi:hypothetical protein